MVRFQSSRRIVDLDLARLDGEIGTRETARNFAAIGAVADMTARARE